MQVNTYVSTNDYETLSKNKPAEFDTVPKYMADIIRKKAEFFRETISGDGNPTVPQYERQ